MGLTLVIIFIYLIIGTGLVSWDFRGNKSFHEPPKFIDDRSIATAVIFILIWPYNLLRRLFR